MISVRVPMVSVRVGVDSSFAVTHACTPFSLIVQTMINVANCNLLLSHLYYVNNDKALSQKGTCRSISVNILIDYH